MYKEKITVPRGVKFIGRDWIHRDNCYNLENYPFPHIVNKVLTGCGYTEYCLTNNQDLILISPRKFLLENKLGQHLKDPNIYYAENRTEIIVNYERDISNNKVVLERDNNLDSDNKYESIEEFRNKVREHVTRCRIWNKPVKILVTYDSFRHVKDTIGNQIKEFQIVVDEFQSVFIDARFKSDAELELLNNLKGLQKICFVSATPMLDKYLEMLPEFRDLPYYEFDWETEEPTRVTKPKLDIKFTSKSLNFWISRVIQDYLAGNFDTRTITDEFGVMKLVRSKEAVFFLNSVKGICRAITSNMLSLEQCNILCARTYDNNKQIRDAFNTVIKKRAEQEGIKNPELLKDMVIGKIPLEGQPHKMFTFCTRTVYLGADFYSRCASTYIFSDSNIDCLSVDISMDLEQILGRQRLKENPWKNNATLFVKTTRGSEKVPWEVFKERLEEKERKTISLLSIHQGLSGTKRHDMAENLQKVAKMCHYKDDYVAINEHTGKDITPVFNRLMQVSEIRAFEMQQIDYADRFTVTNNMLSRGLVGNIRDENLIKLLSEEFYNIRKTEDKLQFLVTKVGSKGLTKDEIDLFFSLIPDKYRNYYDNLGFDGIRAHRYNEAEVKREQERLCENSQKETSLRNEIYRLFKVGNRYVKADVKDTLKSLYERIGYQKTAKATDLEEYFEVKKIYTSDKKNGFEILRKK